MAVCTVWAVVNLSDEGVSWTRRTWHFHERGFPVTSLWPLLSPNDLQRADGRRRALRHRISIAALLFASLLPLAGNAQTERPLPRVLESDYLNLPEGVELNQNREAGNLANGFWKKILTSCSTSDPRPRFQRTAFFLSQGRLYEYMNPQPRLWPNEITPADALNGIEWQGSTNLWFDAWRTMETSSPSLHTWSDWTDVGEEPRQKTSSKPSSMVRFLAR